MNKKILIFIFMAFSLTNCGFVPIYSEKNVTDFEITSLKIEGDSKINDILKNKLRKYFDNNGKKKYKISIETYYEKISAAKDLTGNATNVNLKISVDLKYLKINVDDGMQEKTIKFSKSQIIKKNQNNYEQSNYEKILINNMSELLTDKIILHLARSE